MDIILVGGFNHLETYEFVNGKDDIPYLMENYKNVWNHQPVMEYPDNIYIYMALYGTNVPPFSDPEIPIKKYANILSI